MRITFVALFFLIGSICFSQINPNDITIARDTFGIPHIFAKTDAEVAYGLAWAHCEDDFEHIQYIMVTANARLGELQGKEGAATDYFVKFIKAKEHVDKFYETDISPNYKNILQSYADGINSYASKHPTEVKLKNIFPITPKTILIGYHLILTSMVGTPKALQYVIKGKPDEYIFNASAGSNAFAFNKGITSDSATYLVINPHVPLEGQGSWYEAHLCSEENWNIYGVLIPGMTSPAMGCNENLGWAITFNWPDYVDIYKMEINPQKKNQYKFDGEWYNFEKRRIKLKVKTKLGKISVKKNAYWCIYGPAYKTKKGIYALRYSTMHDIKAAEQWHKMGKTKQYVEFYETMEIQGIPLFNFMMADNQDHIFYLFNAKLPIRNTEFNWQKTLPGNTSKTLWTSYYRLNMLPQRYNPRCGFLYNTNNTPFHCTAPGENVPEQAFNKESAFSWNRINNRDLRFMEIMKDKKQLSFNDIKKIKYDSQYPKNAGGVHKIFNPIYQLDEKKYPDITDAIIKLKKWDFTGYAQNREAALVALTFNYLFDLKKAAYNELETGFIYSEDELVKAIRYSKKYLLTHYKTIDIEFGNVQRLVREDKSYPAPGFPECLQAMTSEAQKNGILKAENGDSFIMFAKFSKKGNEYECVVPYGESRRKNNPHLTDQMELYSKQKTKKISLNKNEVLQTATRIYHPQ